MPVFYRNHFNALKSFHVLAFMKRGAHCVRRILLTLNQFYLLFGSVTLLSTLILLQKKDRSLVVSQDIQNQNPVLKACCGSNCEEFQRPEDMIGISCCGDRPSNQAIEICCENVPRRRKQNGDDRCCGNSTISFDQTCCQKIVHNIPNGDCCGGLAYARNNLNAMCCNDVLHLNMESGLSCCGTNTFDGGLRESCCGGSVYLKELFDGCCAIFNSNPLEYKPYNTQTQLCCDAPIDQSSSKKCCYLRDAKTGKFYPRSYDSATECCTFPYSAITQKNAEGQCLP